MRPQAGRVDGAAGDVPGREALLGEGVLEGHLVADLTQDAADVADVDLVLELLHRGLAALLAERTSQP